MDILRILLIGIVSVLFPIIVVIGVLFVGILVAVTIDEWFETFISKDKYK